MFVMKGNPSVIIHCLDNSDERYIFRPEQRTGEAGKKRKEREIIHIRVYIVYLPSRFFPRSVNILLSLPSASARVLTFPTEG